MSSKYRSRLALGLLLTLVLFTCSCGRFLHQEEWGCCDKENSVMALAKEIDYVECHLDQYGTIVAKTPAIWGDSRLTKHRQEFEKQMESELERFEAKLQGFIARSDQAYLAHAMALSAAISGKAAQVTDADGKALATGTPGVIAVTTNATSLNPTATSASTPAGDPVKPTTAGTTAPNNASTVVTQTAPFSGLSQVGFSGFTSNNTVSLEPTVFLDQKARYLNHLHEIRRINEGDDISVSPGYGLYLVRVPVSVLPGKCSRTGHGAEITMSINSQYGDELLPKTFRNLVLNDLIDLLGVPVFEFTKLRRSDATAVSKDGQPAGKSKRTTSELLKVVAGSKALAMPTSNGRRTRLPIAPSQIVSILGSAIEVVSNSVQNLDPNEDFSAQSILDIHKLLSAELDAAYDLLAQPPFQEHLWWTETPKGLAEAIRRNDKDAVETFRNSFFVQINFDPARRPDERAISPVTAHLAWAVLVEASLLNDRLVEDMKTVNTEKGCACLPAAGWLPFYGPNPSKEAREAFQQYVACRWPTHVFALDPVTQDENIGDVYSRRRETQLAYALAFASGNMSQSSFTRYTRRLETDMATIALHRTAVGFAHGPNHFGWRFYPRFQTPPVEGNLTVLTRDLILGGPTRNQDLRKTQIEPGMRECVALVIMPSFVSNLTLDTHSNWFCLTNPKHTAPTMKETMRLSESIQRMQTNLPLLCDSDRYRAGEAGRLLRRVEQLSASLPLQTLHQQVPYESTLGGFAMFSSGSTDLAPRLIGFYGEPGVVHPGRETTVYLVGDHFGIHDTHVLAGNKICPFTMLSRRCLRVTLPADVRVVKDQKIVDVHVATSYGVSGHLQIPVRQPDGDEEETQSPYKWVGSKAFTAKFKIETDNSVKFTTAAMPTGLAIQVPAYWNAEGTQKLTLDLIEGGKLINSGPLSLELRYDRAQNQLVTTEDLNAETGSNSPAAQVKTFLAKQRESKTITLRGRLVSGTLTAPIRPDIIIIYKKEK